MSEKEQLKGKNNLRVAISTLARLRLTSGAVEEPVVSRSDTQVKQDGEFYAITCSDTESITVPEGWGVRVTEARDRLIVKEFNAPLVVEDAYGDVSLISISAPVTLRNVKGDLRVRHADALEIGEVLGDVAIRGATSADIGTITGDLAAATIAGAFTAEAVRGDASVRSVIGNLTLGSVAGDCSLHDLKGGRNTATIADDLRLYGPLAAGEHAFTVSGDLAMRWPPTSPLNLTANAPQVSTRIAFDSEMRTGGSFVGSIGSNGANVTLTATGSIVVKADKSGQDWEDAASFTVDLDGLGERISAEISAKIGEVTARMNELSTVFDANSLDRFEAKAERAARKAERAIDRAMRRMEQRMATAQGATSSARSRRSSSSTTQGKAKEADPSVEQQKILEMLQQGKITVEQANQLLEALS